MRLPFTGWGFRLSRKNPKPPLETLRCKSTDAAASGELPSTLNPVIRRVEQGHRAASFKTVDIYPGDNPIPPQEDPFKAFLRHRNEPNKIIREGSDAGVLISSNPHKLDSASNLSPTILKLLDRHLYAEHNHPISTTRKLIQSVFPQPKYQHYTATNPVVTTAANFDVLGFPADHPGRSSTDTYYVNKDEVLRTHTSAHQHAAFKAMAKLKASYGYTICADVFRRDSIDRSHFPVFHQMEGARLWRKPKTDSHGIRISSFEGFNRRIELIQHSLRELPRVPVDAEDPNPAFHDERNPKQSEHKHEEVRLMAAHLKRSLETLVARVFHAAREARVASGHLDADTVDQPLKVRWVEAYFPFTTPSWELEVLWQGEWLELLGCGIVQQPLLHNAGVGDRIGWAWGLGVERLAMLLFGIPDIRLFWSQDPRFLDQFQDKVITRYQPFSRYPACYKDIAFWIDSSPPTTVAETPSTSITITEPQPASPKNPHSGSSSLAKPGLAAAAGGDSTKASPSPATTQPASPSSSSSSSSPSPAAATFHENNVMEVVRDVAGSLVEDVRLVDEFRHPNTGRTSLCYRVNYRSPERTLTNDETNRLHEELGRRLVRELGVELR